MQALITRTGFESYLSGTNAKYLNATIKERNDQILTYLEKGGNLFVFLPQVFRFTMEVETETEPPNFEEKSFDLLETIGLTHADFKIKKQVGDIIDYKEIYKDFFNQFESSYDLVFEKHLGTSIGQVKKSLQAISLQIPIKNGNIIFLPSIRVIQPFGKNTSVYDAFIDLDKKLRDKSHLKSEKSTAPLWLDNYSFGDELIQKQALQSLLNEKGMLEIRIKAQQAHLNNYKDLKQLLYNSGDELELSVEKALIEIGYKSQPTDYNRDDLILSKDNDITVIEIKGVKGSAAEKYAAQLTKWVNNYHLEHDILPKGILIVNAFKDMPLKDRTETVFPNQMLPYCKKMEYCLFTTTQLLELYLDFKDSKISFDEVHELLNKTIGVLKYESINKIIG
jgi:hypothetical protein